MLTPRCPSQPPITFTLGNSPGKNMKIYIQTLQGIHRTNQLTMGRPLTSKRNK